MEQIFKLIMKLTRNTSRVPLTDNIDTIEYISFLVRLWHEQDSKVCSSNWRAEVEHIQTGKYWEFNNIDDLFFFLRQRVNETKR
jgi:hypothetical protein